MPNSKPDSTDSTPTISKRRSWLLTVLAAAVLVATGGLLLAARDSRAENLPDDLVSCLAEAQEAHVSHDIVRARRILEHAEGLAGEAKDAAEVQRRLALFDWRYHHRFDPARERLLKATEGARASEAWAALARLEQARADYSAAGEAARKALANAHFERERLEARLAAARAAVAASMALRWDGKVFDHRDLRPAFEDIYDFVRTEPGLLEPSRLLLRAALLLDEGEAALLGWRSYFHVTEASSTANAVADAGEDLARILPSWAGAGATEAMRIELVSALARTRFFTEASIVAREPRAGETVRRHPEVDAVLTYTDTIDRIRELSEEFYRQTLLGEEKPSKLEDGVEAELTAAVREIEGEGSKAGASFQAVKDYLGDRFAAYISLGRTATYYDLHMGHRVIDETRTVEQYGRRADLRFVALDNMVSNGFQSWAWEGPQHGGWARKDTIYQVRSAYVGGPISIWRRLNDPDDLEEFEEMIARETARDDGRAKENPYAFLPGLALRLTKQGVFAALDRLKAEGLTGAGLRARFLVEMETAKQESSIFAHEGRHAIDKRAGITRSKDLERTAKLSEVAFAPMPRLALGSIFSGSIGDSTPHGKANLRIMKGVVRWMEEHRGEIAGLDPQRPLLPQFDLLTDDQIRAAFRSMDPLYTGTDSS